VCSFALKDDVIEEYTTTPIRDVTNGNKGGQADVTVRMVTGDMLETAKQVAKSAGIMYDNMFEE